MDPMYWILLLIPVQIYATSFEFWWEALVKKAGTNDLSKALLEEVVRAYFLADETRIPAVRNAEDWLIFMFFSTSQDMDYYYY